jgi:hypothetical protein
VNCPGNIWTLSNVRTYWRHQCSTAASSPLVLNGFGMRF